jgi:FkbH-like protein
MPLKREHLSAWKINWKPKSDNVVDLSLILDLSLNSFVFIDNDPRECLEIERRCPEVLVLCPPADDGKMKQFLRNVWDFDRRPLTRDDQKRTLYYRQNADRAQERKHWTSLEGFLQSLELRVDISRLVQDDIRRVQQLMERTTQFNLNGIRYSLAELEGAMRSSERLSFVVRATDRFGDYGTIGLIICRLAQASLVIESLLLSCRALGKGVEDRVFSALAEMAENLGATRLDLAYRPTNRNITLRSFLEKKGACKIGEYWTLYPESPDRTNAPNPKSLG